MRFTRWVGGVPVAAWLFLSFALVRFSISLSSPATTGLIGMVPNLLLVLAIGVVVGSRVCWAAAFVLTGLWVTLLAMDLGATVFGAAHGVDATAAVVLVPWVVQFGALVALHPRWNDRWAEATSR